ncbi:MAG: hypothetical protein E7207_07775 [Clostridium butyricum]|nr:hypothetical protein [Clostridium butyricum]
MANADIEQNFKNIRNLLDVDAPEGNTLDDMYDDVLKHNLWGIHIKAENDALSDSNPHVCIGWSHMGDMSSLYSKEDFMQEYDKHYQKNNRAKVQDVGMLKRFTRDVKVGDYIIFAEPNKFHIGKIESDYYYDNAENPNQNPDYTNNRKVTWLKKNISRKVLSKSMHNSLATAMSIFGLNNYRTAVVDLLKGVYKKYGEGEVSGVDDVILKFETEVNIPYDRNRIIFGAPGTGKSYTLKNDSESVQNEYNGDFERVTFHPDYTYSQFVGTYKPVMDDNEQIKYEYVPGPFMRVLVDALRSALDSNPKPYILLIEEINRAKVAAVFGDVFQLLDRDDNGVSEYEIQASEDIRKYLAKPDVLGGNPDNYRRLRIPNNMYIWATMNSADQGVFPMDTAFKRRWSFEYLGINQGEDKIKNKCLVDIPGSDEEIEWNTLRKAINDKMSSADFRVNEDKLMGPYFIARKVIERGDTKEFIKVFTSKIIMYLYEDAVKQRKNSFFDGCPDTSKYSAVCDYFRTNGLEIFGKNFKTDYYDKYKG